MRHPQPGGARPPSPGKATDFLVAGTATLVGVNGQVSVWTALATAPIFVWELSLGVWLTVKGFKPSAVTAGTPFAGASPA